MVIMSGCVLKVCHACKSNPIACYAYNCSIMYNKVIFLDTESVICCVFNNHD